MSNKDKEMKNMNDSFENLLDGIGDRMLPPPELEKAVIAGSYYRGRADAGMHVRKITGAIVAYAVGVMLFLGALMLLPRLFDTQPPMGTNPSIQTTDTPHQTTAVTPPKIYPSPMPITKHSLIFDSSDEFQTFFREFSSVNGISLVVPVGLDSENVISRYVFDGDMHSSDMIPDGYAFESMEKNFQLTVLGFQNAVSESDRRDHSNDEDLHKQCDYAIYLEPYVNCIPVESLDRLKLVPYEGEGDPSKCLHGDHLTDYVSWQWDPATMRRYDVVEGTQIRLSFITRVKTEGADQLHDELSKLVMDNLVSLVSTKNAPYYAHQYQVVTTGGDSCIQDIVTTYTCKICDDYYMEILPSKGHDYANCTCVLCGKDNPDIPHDYVNGVCSYCNEIDPNWNVSPGLEYEWNGDSYTVVGFGTYNSTHLEIPSTHNGKPVTKIGAKAFMGKDCIGFVTIPDSITEIGAEAFADCTKLLSLTIGDGVEKIGDRAFSGCKELYLIRLGSGLSEIGAGAFSQSAMEDVTYSGSHDEWNATRKGAEWDAGTPDYTIRFTIDSPMNTNGSQGLEFGLTKDGYAVVGRGSCTDIHMVIPSACNGKTVTAIDSGAFSWCTDILSVQIPDTVKWIGDQAFVYCESLTEVVIPDSVVTIGDHAFADCYSLTGVTISNSVKTIECSAFADCMNLSKVIYKGTQEQWDAIEKDEDWSWGSPEELVFDESSH